MRRIQEKVKDVVDAKPYKSLRDFTADPLQTISIYHFTDLTSDLMAKWLDRVLAVQSNSGAAYALAGYRGVGKSHFLAALGAIVSHPELRSRIADQHVASSAQSLRRARYPVAYVRRGTNETLADELKDSIAKTFEIKASDLTGSISDLLQTAAAKAGELPFVLFIDTAFERASRVVRDDGVLLGEIAQIAKNLNVFVAVALDDDIAGADGINAAIAGNFTIEYLDQEHLYRIVDTYIFPKYRQMQPLVHEIYTNFRALLPHFRWSEQRFSLLYPLHPILLEIAPFVRLYQTEFALLSFAAEAGGKNLNRPANSLIALDEVFDTVENAFRKIEELKEAFLGYDKLNGAINLQIPVMQRLQAKLVLKALFLLSLEGSGTTAGEITAAMLIYDENEPLRAVKMVEELLEKFAAVFPDGIQRAVEAGREVRYNLKISSQDNLNNDLAKAVKNVSPAVTAKILRRVASERFSDWSLAEDDSSTECQINWRGGLRRGRLIWNLENSADASENNSTNAEFLDWEIVVAESPEQSKFSSAAIDTERVLWQIAPLRAEEIEAVLRYWVLLTDTTLRETYGEQMRAAGHAQMMTVEKIWNRIFLEDAKLIIGNLDYNFSETARAAQTLSELFSRLLAPFLDERFPNHPRFARTLGMTEVAELVGDFFSGARQYLAGAQQSAETFALPLGLVRRNEDNFVLESQENLSRLPHIQAVLAEIKRNSGEMTSLETIYKILKQTPFGLTPEAQHLILTALVANRQIEFVTREGDRINRRSLDLKIIWDDIAGVAAASGVVYSNERLIEWARILTGTNLPTALQTPEQQKIVKNALDDWLSEWKTSQILERFNSLPDEILNTKIWRLAARAEKTFGAVAEAIENVSDDLISLEDGLQQIADAFSDSEKEFSARRKDLVVLDEFTGSAATREEIWRYLALCEATEDEKLEFFREKLFQIIEASRAHPSAALNRQMENDWKTFHARFSDHYADKHDLVMKSRHLQDKCEEILRGDQWWEFENLARIPFFQSKIWQNARQIRRRIDELNCQIDVREQLKTHPFCACGFSLSKIREWEKLPAELEKTIETGRKSFRKSLAALSRTLIPFIENFSANFRDDESSAAALHLTEVLKKSFDEMPLFSDGELIVLQKVCADMPQNYFQLSDAPGEAVLQI